MKDQGICKGVVYPNDDRMLEAACSACCSADCRIPKATWALSIQQHGIGYKRVMLQRSIGSKKEPCCGVCHCLVKRERGILL